MKKICSKCGIEKDATEFHKDRRASDGLCSRCKCCKNEQTREWRKTNPEKVRDYKNEWVKANPEKVRKHNNEWVKANREKVNVRQRERWKVNREKVNNSRRKWRETNREKVQAYYNARSKKETSELADRYIKKGLVRQFGIPTEEIDPDMVEAKRRELKYYRIYNQLTKDSK